MKIGDVWYEKHTVTEISQRTNTVSEAQVERVDAIPQKWIPVSERLPEDRMACLVYGKMHFVPDHVDEKNWFYDYSIGCFYSAFGWSIRGDMDVIAWMPLPEPYKGEEE